MRTLTYVNPSGTSIELSDAMYGLMSVTGLGVPDLNLQEKKAPYQDGSTYIDQLFEPREVVCEGSLCVSTNLSIYEKRRVLVNALNPKPGPGNLTYVNDNGNWYLPQVTPQGPIFSNRSINPIETQKYQVTFYAYDPYWKNVNATTANLSGIGTLSLTNNGNVDCPIQITLQGPITNPKIINNTTEEYIRIEKTLASGEWAIIYTGFGQKTLIVNTGTIPVLEFPIEFSEQGNIFSYITTYNGLQYLDSDSTMFSLDVGVNELELIDEGSNTGMTMAVTYRERFVGV